MDANLENSFNQNHPEKRFIEMPHAPPVDRQVPKRPKPFDNKTSQDFKIKEFGNVSLRFAYPSNKTIGSYTLGYCWHSTNHGRSHDLQSRAPAFKEMFIE